jgi:5-methylcytosine-specific restriction endonuclease McrA
MKVLLLNKSEEVIDVISWQEAVTKLLSGRATKPSGYTDEYEIRTVRGVFRLPSAIVLVSYVRIPYKRAAVNKENVLKRDGYTCQYCGKRLSNSTGTIDHVFPTSRGGKHEWKNVVASCSRCNNVKSDKTPNEAGMKLLSAPFIPTRDFILLHGLGIHSRETWTRWMRVNE